MAITVQDADFDQALFAASAGPAVAVPTTVTAGDFLFAGIHIRDETNTVTGISDDVNGSTGWTLATGPDDATAGSAVRSYIYYRENSAGGTVTITFTLSAAANGSICVGRCHRVGHGITFQAATASATTQTDGDSTTATIVATREGAFLGFLAINNSVALTGVGTGEVNVTNETARSHVIAEVFASGGTYGVEATFGGTPTTVFTGIVILEPAAGGSDAVPVCWAQYRQRRVM